MGGEAGEDVLHKPTVRLMSSFQYNFSSLRAATMFKNQMIVIIVVHKNPILCSLTAFSLCAESFISSFRTPEFLKNHT